MTKNQKHYGYGDNIGGDKIIHNHGVKNYGFKKGKELFDQGLYKESTKYFINEIDKNPKFPDSYLFYCIAKLSIHNISNINDSTIDEIYRFISILKNSKHERIATYLWLIVFYEHTNMYSAPERLESQLSNRMSEAFDYQLSEQEKNLLSSINLRSEETDMLLLR